MYFKTLPVLNCNFVPSFPDQELALAASTRNGLERPACSFRVPNLSPGASDKTCTLEQGRNNHFVIVRCADEDVKCSNGNMFSFPFEAPRLPIKRKGALTRGRTRRVGCDHGIYAVEIQGDLFEEYRCEFWAISSQRRN